MAACNKSYVVTGLGFGDEGKGSIVDALAKLTNASLVVRHNGGAQAAHNVVTPDGRHHTFAQWGSGTLATGCRTLLSSRTVLDPLAMLSERAALINVGVRDPLKLLTVDPNALVITPFHRAANRMREQLRGERAHGSCGVGVGETVSDALLGAPTIRWRDMHRRNFPSMLWDVRASKLAQVGALTDMVEFNQATETLESWGRTMTAVAEAVEMADDLDVIKKTQGPIIYEGAQGVLLDQDLGFHPHTTWSTTTSANALELIAACGRQEEDPEIIGVLRAFHTRHGAGPFVTGSDPNSHLLKGEHNSGGFAGAFRCGAFEIPLARFAVAVDHMITSIALTCLDRSEHFTVADYDANLCLPTCTTVQEGNTARLIAATNKRGKFQLATEMPRIVAGVTNRPVRIQSWGPAAHDKRYSNFPLTRGI